MGRRKRKHDTTQPKEIKRLKTVKGRRRKIVTVTGENKFSSAEDRAKDNETAEPQEKRNRILCPVCLCNQDEIKSDLVVTKCGHVFCLPCLRMCLNNSHRCPICEKAMASTDYQKIYL